FRANPTALRQPIARKRLITHLQNAPEDAQSLMGAWGQHATELLDTLRGYQSDAQLSEQLPALQHQYGERLTLALIHEERDISLTEGITEDPVSNASDKVNTATLQKQVERSQKKAEELR